MLRKLLVLWAADRIARAIHPIVDAYESIYRTPDEDGPDSGTVRYDPRSTIAGQAEVAANRDHGTLEVIAQRRMGFTSQRRANEACDRD